LEDDIPDFSNPKIEIVNTLFKKLFATKKEIICPLGRNIF